MEIKMKTKQMRPVAILAGSRTPFTKSFTHFSKIPNKTLLTATLKNLVQKTNLEGVKLGDVAAGAVMKNAEDWNLTRESV